MALSIYALLRRLGSIDQDQLAESFAARFNYDRGYGSGASRLLQALREGESWRDLAARQHGGQGSCGNGAAMRVAPLGAFFHADPPLLRSQAMLSAVVTHSHADGIAGAVAVATAAGAACRSHSSQSELEWPLLLEEALQATGPGAVREGLLSAVRLGPQASVAEAVAQLGNGSDFLASDTVPLALWLAATSTRDFRRALERAASALGDVDTICAIVGGVVALSVGWAGLPGDWLDRREPLPTWIDE